MQELTDLVKEYLDYFTTNLHTCFPGVVTEYDAEKRRATVQPSLKRRAGNKKYIDFPLLIDVPVQYPGTKKYTIHFPLEEGDEVAIYFSERALEMWKETGMDGIEDPDPRRFDLCDAYCTPGLQPQEFIPATEKGLQILHHDGYKGDFISQVLMDDDKIEMKYKKKSTVLMEDDHIKASTEKCYVDMTAQKIDAQNGKDKITADSGEVTVEAANNATVKAGGNANIKAGGNVDVEAVGTAKIKSTALTLTGGTVTIAGTVSPTGKGALCAIPNCLFTGAPHIGETSSGA